MPLVLADTSVWVSHFRHAEPTLQTLLATDQVLCHPLVVLELACGTPPSSSRADARGPSEASSVGDCDPRRITRSGHSGATLRFWMWRGGCVATRVRPADSRRAVVDAGQEAGGFGDPTGSLLQALRPLAGEKSQCANSGHSRSVVHHVADHMITRDRYLAGI